MESVNFSAKKRKDKGDQICAELEKSIDNLRTLHAQATGGLVNERGPLSRFDEEFFNKSIHAVLGKGAVIDGESEEAGGGYDKIVALKTLVIEEYDKSVEKHEKY